MNVYTVSFRCSDGEELTRLVIAEDVEDAIRKVKDKFYNYNAKIISLAIFTEEVIT